MEWTPEAMRMDRIQDLSDAIDILSTAKFKAARIRFAWSQLDNASKHLNDEISDIMLDHYEWKYSAGWPTK